MKVNKIVYWTSTILFAAFFLMSVSMYISKDPQVVEGMKLAGFPPFMLGILGTAKLLGVIALLQPRFKGLKEWAYAGFTILLIGATWVHVATSTPFVMPLVFLAVLATSYIFWKRTQNVTERRPAFA
jgi:4-hydroxybenzoate polyprenyltransferase